MRKIKICPLLLIEKGHILLILFNYSPIFKSGYLSLFGLYVVCNNL